MADPTVSVVIPTYKRPNYLLRAVDSVLAQTYDDVQLIVVDDHSPTPAAETLDDLDLEKKELTVIRHDENKGANEARNTGIRAADGEYVAFLDDDDEWKPEKLRQQVMTFERADDNVGVVYTGAEYIYDEYTRTVLFSLRGDVTEQLLRGRSMGQFSTMMVRTAIIEEAGLPDNRFPSWQDREWSLRLSTRCAFEPVKEPLTIRRRMSDETSITDDFEQKRDVSYPLFLKKHRDLAAQYGWECERAFVGSLSAILGKCALKTGHYSDARKYLLKALFYYPFNRSRWIYAVVSLGGIYTYQPVRELVHILHRLRTTPTRK